MELLVDKCKILQCILLSSSRGFTTHRLLEQKTSFIFSTSSQLLYVVMRWKSRAPRTLSPSWNILRPTHTHSPFLSISLWADRMCILHQARAGCVLSSLGEEAVQGWGIHCTACCGPEDFESDQLFCGKYLDCYLSVVPLIYPAMGITWCTLYPFFDTGHKYFC